MYIEVYNIVFTALPIVLFCVFDQDVPKAVGASSPWLYTEGIMRLHYTHRGFVGWMFEACFLAGVTIYVPALALGYPGWSLSSPENGDPGVDSISLTAMSLVCICVNLRLAIELHSWHVLEHTFMWGSIIAIEFFCLLFSYVRYPAETWPVSYSWNSLNSVVAHVWDAFPYWLVTVLVVVLVLAPRTLGKAWDKLFADPGAHRMASAAAQSAAGTSRKLLRSLSSAQMHRPTPQEMARYHTELGANLVATPSNQSMCEAAQQGGDAVRINATVYAPPPPPSSCSMTSQLSPAAYSAATLSFSGAAAADTGRNGPSGRVAFAQSPHSVPSRDRRGTRSAFSNDDKTSARVLASGGRRSLGAYPVSLDTDEEVTSHGESTPPVECASHGGNSGQGGDVEMEMGELR